MTENQWNNGKCWYDGLNQTEVIARCIFGENNGEKRERMKKNIGGYPFHRVHHK